MKFITSIIEKLKSKNIPLPLGRWRIENCNKQMNNKVDLSNEDHCGPCGQYILDKTALTNDKTKMTEVKKYTEKN